MGLIDLTTGPALLSGDNENVVGDYEGTVRLALASGSLVPDPGFFEFNEATGKYKHMTLGDPPRPTHWAPFVRDRHNVRHISRQVTAVLPLDKHVFDLENALIHGPSPVLEDKAIDITAPGRTKVRTEPMSVIGLPAGHYTIAFGWATGADWQTTTLVTNPGPRILATEAGAISQGQGFLITTPPERPKNATALVIFISEPALSTVSAFTAPLYELQRFKVRGLDQFVRITGPAEFKDPVGTKNNTFVGARADLPALDWWQDHNKYATRTRPIVVQIGYAVYTEQGISMSSTPTDWITVPTGEGALFYRPKAFADEVIGWRPEIRFRVKPDEALGEADEGISEWFTIVHKGGKEAFFGRDEEAGVHVSVPSYWDRGDPRTSLVKKSRNERDKTGIPAPTETLEVPTVLNLNSSGLTPGPHIVRTALYHKEEEGPIGPPRRINVAAGEGLRIWRPQIYNLLDNPEGVERRPEDKDFPRGWVFPPKPYPANINVRMSKKGVVKYTDTSNATDLFRAIVTPYAYLPADENKFVIRFNIKLTDYLSGKVRLLIEEYATDEMNDDPTAVQPTNPDAVLPTTTQEIEVFGGNIDVTRVIRIQRGPGEQAKPGVVKIATTTKAIRVRIQGYGPSRAGGRRFDVEFSQWGVFEGWGEPTKVNRLGQQRGDGTEDTSLSYPPGGKCFIRENPKNGPHVENYTLLDRAFFENGLGRWTANTSSDAMVGAVSNNAGITGTYGLRIGKPNATPTDNTEFSYAHAAFTDGANLAMAWDMFIKSHSNHVVEIAAIRSADSRLLALLRITAGGDIEVTPYTNAGAGTSVFIGSILDDNEHISMELQATGAGTINGRLKVYLGRSRSNRILVADIGATVGIDWSDRQAGEVNVGHRRLTLAGAAKFNFFYDNITVTREGTTGARQQGGNYIEYDAAPRTPQNELYGPYGLRIPARPRENMAVGINLWYKGLTPRSEVFRVRAMDAEHNVLQVFRAVGRNLGGESQSWERHTTSFTTPPNTAYIEFFGNWLGGGTIRIHGLQVERGNIARPFDLSRQRNGWFSTYIKVSPSGMHNRDPMADLLKLIRYRFVRAYGITDPSNSYTVQFRSGFNMTTLLDPNNTYKNTWQQLNPDHNYIEVKVSLTTTNDEKTPKIRRILADLARPYAQLLRENGGEHKGGVLVNNLTGVSRPPRSDEVEMASGAMAENPWGILRTQRISFNMYAFRRSVMEAILAHKHHVVETPGYRYHIRFEEVPAFTPAPNTRIQIDYDNEFFQMYSAEGVTAIVEWVEELE